MLDDKTVLISVDVETKSIGEFCEIFLAQLYPIIWISL